MLSGRTLCLSVLLPSSLSRVRAQRGEHAHHAHHASLQITTSDAQYTTQQALRRGSCQARPQSRSVRPRTKMSCGPSTGSSTVSIDSHHSGIATRHSQRSRAERRPHLQRGAEGVLPASCRQDTIARSLSVNWDTFGVVLGFVWGRGGGVARSNLSFPGQTWSAFLLR